MEHIKYPSIKNLNGRVVKRLKDTSQDTKFFVQEKIHGSNICFIINKQSIHVATRNLVLNENSTFPDVWKNILKEYETKFRELYNVIKPNSNIRIYGEMYGDKIFKQIPYGSKTKYSIFDILIDDTEFLTYNEYAKLCKTLNIPFCEAIHECKGFKLAMSFNPNIKSMYAVNDNIAEGVVIRSSDKNRIIFKKKSKKFKEIVKPKQTKTNNFIIPEILNYINQNRLLNVISKLGKNTNKHKLAGLLAKDVWKDFSDNDLEILKKYKKEEIKTCRKNLFNRCLEEVNKCDIEKI